MEELQEKLGSLRMKIAIMHWVDKKTQEEIADELGKSQGTISYHCAITRRLFPALPKLDGRHRTWRESDIAGFLATYRDN